MLFKRAILAFFLAVATSFAAGKPDQNSLQAIADAYFARRFAEPPPVGLSYDAALATQKEYLQIIGRSFGKRAGYKVGLVTPAGQQRYNISHPVRGVLFEKMLLPDDSHVPVNYGTRPIVEPDLLVRVKDEALNDAKTIVEAAQHLSEIICFIELADGLFRTNAPMDGGALTAANVGARAGILGETRKIEPTPEFIKAFAGMSLVFRDKTGRELSRAPASGVMGNPLNAVLWLVNDLKSTGEKLKTGDLISLGSPSPQATPRAGDKFTLLYEGLPGGPLKASVTFEAAK
jgi:2-keto-4-pentenoate hydratase